MDKPWAELTDHECNALVAKEVMGWQYCQRETVIINKGTGERTIAHYWVWVTPTGEEVQDRHLPCFKTDIAAAWRVVEKLQHQGMTVEVYNGSHGGCTVKIFDFEKSRKWGSSSVDGASEAICLAALKAAGYEGEL